MSKSLVLFCCLLFSTSLYGNVKGIDNYELNKFMKKRMVIVDVRHKHAWDNTGIIPNSYKITYENAQELESWLRVFSRIVKNRSIAFILVSENGRKAYKLSKLLNEKIGYHKVYYLKGGIENWMKEDGRVVKY